MEEDDRFAGSEAYLEMRGADPIAQVREEFNQYLRRIERYVPITSSTRFFEVGVGTGWFPILCAQRGLACDGIELNPVYLEHARDLGREYGSELAIEPGSIEDVEIRKEAYDVIVAFSVFEHVEHYGRGLANVYSALKPGGLFYFYSTNKFALRSGEYPGFPLYGWLPYSLRRRLRVARQGERIVRSSGIDFNQFTYWGLRRHLNSLGYREVLDRFDFLDSEYIADPKPWKPVALAACKRVRPIRAAARLFAGGNGLICLK